MLNAIHGLITVNFFLRNGILTMPIEQEREAVGREVGRARSEHLRSVSGVEGVGAITRDHIEERACEIAFVVIVGFVAGTDIGGSGRAQFTEAMMIRILGETAERTAYHAVGVVRTEVIDTCVGGIDIKEVRDHRTGTQPGLADKVLFVPTVADSSLGHVGICHRKMAGRVHIPEGVVVEIGLLVIGFETGISDHGMVIDDAVERIKDVIRILLAIDVIVIVFRDGGDADDDVSIAYLRP